MLLLSAAGFHSSARAQQRSGNSSAASISGRVTIEGKPASGVVVVLTRQEAGPEQRRFADTTDAEGRFDIADVAPGWYAITPHTYAYVLADQDPNSGNSKRIIVGAGEAIDDVSLDLVRGCVVTGRVVGEDGRPVVGGYVQLKKLRGDGITQGEYVNPPLYDMSETDDRGVYRLFCVPAGRYLVSVRLSLSRGGANYIVFYPDTRDESKAKVIEVSASEEKTEINITAVPPEKTYAASGRLIDAATGKPVPDIYIQCQPLDGNNEKMSMIPNDSGFRTTESDGEFRLVGLSPGRYRLSISSRSEQGFDWYCDDLNIDVTDEDVRGIELKAHRGASISGVVTVEGSNDPQLFRPLANAHVWASSQGANGLSGQGANTGISPDGRFRLAGLRAGEFHLGASVHENSRKRLSIQRLEVAGQPVRDTIELKEGQSISDARIVMVYGDGVVRGQVKFQNGEPPKNACFYVQTDRKGECSSCQSGFYTQASARGQYTLEGLPPGEYELVLYGRPCAPGNQFNFNPMKQTVRAANGVETRADFIVDLNKKDQ